MPKRKKIKVVYTKLGRQDNWGQSTGEYVIEVEERLKGRKLLEIILHESLHELWTRAEEEEIEAKAAILARTLWHEGFRRVDNDSRAKLQDDT